MTFARAHAVGRQSRRLQRAGTAGRRSTHEDELLELQGTAGNRAVSELVASGRDSAAVQRDALSDAEKRKRLTGLQAIPGSAVTAHSIKQLLGATWDRYASLDAKGAKENCYEAASDIGKVLTRKGFQPDFFCVSWWPAGWSPTSLNHYVVIFQEMVIDATGQQFAGGEPNITPYSTWFDGMKARIPSTTLARWVRGTFGDARGLGAALQATYFELADEGQPLYQYDPVMVARAQAMWHARRNV